MACDPHVYAAVTPAMLDCFSESVESAFGIAVSGDQGSATAMGTSLAWDYQRQAELLTITCTTKPIFLSCDMIYGHLGGMLKKCKE